MNLDRVGIVFQGGGFTGAYSVGFSKAVHEAGIKPIYYQGISVGALTAAGVVAANGDPAAAAKSWLDIEQRGSNFLFSYKEIAKRVWKDPSLYSDRGLRWILNTVDWANVVTSPLPLEFIVFNESTGLKEIIKHNNLAYVKDPTLLAKMALASCSLGGFFPPVSIDGSLYSDGLDAVTGNAIRAGCDVIFLFCNEPVNPSGRGNINVWYQRFLESQHRLGNMLAAKELLLIDQINHRIGLLHRVAQAFAKLGFKPKRVLRMLMPNIDPVFLEKRQVKVVEFRPITPAEKLWVLGFEKGDIGYAINHGYEVGKQILENLKSKK